MRTGGRPRRRRLSAAERRERILDAATIRFGEDGYDATTMAQIARGAGVTVPVLYDHFRSKPDLYAELLERIARLLREATGGDRSFETYVVGFFRFVEERPQAWRLLHRDDAAHAAATRELAESIGVDEPVAAAARSALDGLARWRLEHPDTERDVLARAAIDLLAAGLRRRV